MYRKAFNLLAFLALMSMLLAACAPKAQTNQPVAQAAEPTAPKQQQLLVFNWWTGPGEREAADQMYKAFNDKYPDIKIVNNPVEGGGGESMRAALQSRLNAKLPPDSWQTLGGAELKGYVDAKQLQPLDDVYKKLDITTKIPKPLLNAVSIDGHPYSVPLNMHIQNILYYNKKLFDELKINPPATYDDLIAACDTIKQARPDMVCLGLGSKEKWGDAFVFDSILLGEPGGGQHYVDIYKGKVNVSADTDYKNALKKYAELASKYINSDHANLSWDQAVALVGSGKAAMTLMGTWAIGAFKSSSQWTAGVDFGAVTFPTKPERILLFHPDTYGCAQGAPNQASCEAWLDVVSSPELQIPTDVTQGGLFARIDIDPTKFPDPIRQEMQGYIKDHSDQLILDQHGSILPVAAQTKYWDALAAFTSNPKDVESTAIIIQSLFVQNNVAAGSAWYQWP